MLAKRWRTKQNEIKKMLYRQGASSLKTLKEVDGVEVPDLPPRRVIAVAELERGWLLA